MANEDRPYTVEDDYQVEMSHYNEVEDLKADALVVSSESRRCMDCGRTAVAHVGKKCSALDTHVVIDAASIDRMHRTGHPRLLKSLINGTVRGFANVTIDALHVLPAEILEDQKYEAAGIHYSIDILGDSPFPECPPEDAHGS